MKLYLILLIASAYAANNQPIIGILTVPIEVDGYDDMGYNMLYTSYVKLTESAGALVVPIQWDWSNEKIDEVVENLDGLLFTGGETKIYVNDTQPGYTFNKYTDAASYLMTKAKKFNKAGKIFPVIGICQGFQLMSYIAAEYQPVLSAVADDQMKNRLLEKVDKKSYLLNGLRKEVFYYMTKQVGPFYYHNWGVLPSTYQNSTSFQRQYKVVATSRDGSGQEYITLIEGKKYPFYAVQFHPEKPAFDQYNNPNRDSEQIELGQHIIRQFLNVAKKGNSTTTKQFKLDNVIYNFSPQMIVKSYGKSLAFSYFFKKDNFSTVNQSYPNPVTKSLILNQTEMKAEASLGFLESNDHN